jgi:hypothetical protein
MVMLTTWMKYICISISLLHQRLQRCEMESHDRKTMSISEFSLMTFQLLLSIIEFSFFLKRMGVSENADILPSDSVCMRLFGSDMANVQLI